MKDYLDSVNLWIINKEHKQILNREFITLFTRLVYFDVELLLL